MQANIEALIAEAVSGTIMNKQVAEDWKQAVILMRQVSGVEELKELHRRLEAELKKYELNELISQKIKRCKAIVKDLITMAGESTFRKRRRAA
jgi:hypothetical protein